MVSRIPNLEFSQNSAQHRRGRTKNFPMVTSLQGKHVQKLSFKIAMENDSALDQITSKRTFV